MDVSLYHWNVEQCRSVSEETSFLEMHQYSKYQYNTIKEGILADKDFHKWVTEEVPGRLEEASHGVQKNSSVKLVVQKNAKDPNTWSQNVISLPPIQYLEMMTAFHLPLCTVETTATVGPMFWANFENTNGRFLQVIYRKGVPKTNDPRGFELILSYDFQSCVTRGFLKGGINSNISMYIRHLKGSIEDLVHPMLLPMIILTDKIGGRSEQEHREARFLIRDIESRLNTYGHNLATTQVHANRSSSDLNTINADLTYCHSLVWKHPRSYLDLIDDFQEALNAFLSSLPNYVGAYKRILPVHMRMLSRLKFSRQRMRGMDAFAQSTLSRIDMQRTTLHNILLNRQTQTVLQIEERQQREAHAKFCENQRWSRSQMSLSLLGTLFLPGAFIAALFSTTFFDFQAPADTPIVSPHFWIFWVFAVPLTFLSLVGLGLYRWIGEKRDMESSRR